MSILAPAFLPRCHHYKETGIYFVESLNYPKFLGVSPDGMFKCIKPCKRNNSCQSPLNMPVGKMCLELKCPYTPITDKKLLPVSYYPPQYNGCQLMCELVVTGSKLLWFGSCSKESLALSFIELDATKWQ